MNNIPQQTEDQDENEPVESNDCSTWAKDQELREYYYDDAHGYEGFVDDEETNDEKISDNPTSSDVR